MRHTSADRRGKDGPVIPLSEWTRRCPLPDKPWLVLGKGPSFARRHSVDLAQYNLASLNHVVREQTVDLAHFIDLDALVACAEALAHNADWLCLPRYPHVEFKPSDRPLEEFIDTVPVLRYFADRGRLVWYYHDLATRPELKSRYPPGAWPLVRVDAFSAEAVVNVLAAIGVKQVRTLGVDGGIHYAGAFHDLNGVTRLANGQSSFDRQFIGIYQTTKETGMDYGPLHEPIRVYVGTNESQMVATRVLEYSIRRFATRPVEVVPLLNLPVPTPKDPANQSRTGFSFARFLIPSLAGYKGRGIYVDADMLVFGDIADLWDTPFNGCKVLCTRQDVPPATWTNNAHFQPGRQMSVMLLDCGALDWKIDDIIRGLDEGRYTYRQLMCDLCILPEAEVGEHLDPAWNCLERFTAGHTKLLHLTDMNMQPWRREGNPLRSIWRAFYRAAVEAGVVEPEMVETGIANGWLLPELAEDLTLAPSRRGAEPVRAALEGAPAVRQRSIELENTALRAELGIVRTEAEQLRHECYKHTVAAKQLTDYAHELEAKTREAWAARDAALNEMYRMRTTWFWKLGRGVTNPVGAVRKVLRRAG
ncbi:MAG: glycosyltransferase [Gemmataceae bacterium]